MTHVKDKLQCEVSADSKQFAKATAKVLKISLSQYVDLLLSNAMDRAQRQTQPSYSVEVHRMVEELYNDYKNFRKPWFKRIFE